MCPQVSFPVKFFEIILRWLVFSIALSCPWRACLFSNLFSVIGFLFLSLASTSKYISSFCFSLSRMVICFALCHFLVEPPIDIPLMPCPPHHTTSSLFFSWKRVLLVMIINMRIVVMVDKTINHWLYSSLGISPQLKSREPGEESPDKWAVSSWCVVTAPKKGRGWVLLEE